MLEDVNTAHKNYRTNLMYIIMMPKNGRGIASELTSSFWSQKVAIDIVHKSDFLARTSTL